MNTRATTRHTPVAQHLGRRRVRAVLPWFFPFFLSGCLATQPAPARQAEWEKPIQDIDQKLEQTEKSSKAMLSDLQRRLAAQEAEMRRLQGNLEVVQHENRSLKEQAKEKAVIERDVEQPPSAQAAEQLASLPTTQPAPPAAAPPAPAAAKPGVPAAPPPATAPAPGAAAKPAAPPSGSSGQARRARPTCGHPTANV
ncbi:MAG: hypothetical protein H7836_08910 [Magnetococcus sp. YQC-3]